MEVVLEQVHFIRLLEQVKQYQSLRISMVLEKLLQIQGQTNKNEFQSANIQVGGNIGANQIDTTSGNTAQSAAFNQKSQATISNTNETNSGNIQNGANSIC